MSSDGGKHIVVKIGGSLVEKTEEMDAFWGEIQDLHSETAVVLVHGGGPQMTALANRLGHMPRRVRGRRITTDLDLDIARWTMGGEVNTALVAQADERGLSAVGLSGVDAGQVRVKKRRPWTVEGETIDFGWVGDIERIDLSLLEGLLSHGLLPIVAPLGVDEQGQIYNVNADTVASAFAQTIGAERLMYVTASEGVRRMPSDAGSRLDICTASTYAEGVDEGWIEGGMRVKIGTALDALRDGVDRAVVCSARDLRAQKQATEITLKERGPDTYDAPPKR